jgi:hypothetical protein
LSSPAAPSAACPAPESCGDEPIYSYYSSVFTLRCRQAIYTPMRTFKARRSMPVRPHPGTRPYHCHIPFPASQHARISIALLKIVLRPAVADLCDAPVPSSPYSQQNRPSGFPFFHEDN